MPGIASANKDVPSTALPDGTVVAEHQSAAVPTSLLREILEWRSQGATMEDVVNRLRFRTVPPGYHPHTWHPGWYTPVDVVLHVYVSFIHVYVHVHVVCVCTRNF